MLSMFGNSNWLSVDKEGMQMSIDSTPAVTE